jgi:hypothetical protein
MSGETTTARGYVYDEVNGETNDLSKLNRLGLPSVTVNDGAIDTDQLADGAVTSDKLDSDVLAQINADAIIGDGSITAAKIADGAVTYVKLNQDVLDKVVIRDSASTTQGNYLRYTSTNGETEEVAVDALTGRIRETAAAGASGTTSPQTATASTGINPQTDCTEIEGTFEAFDYDGSGTDEDYIFTVQFSFTKNAAGTWSGKSIGILKWVNGSGFPVALSPQTSPSTGTTSLTGTIGRLTYTITANTGDITFNIATTSGSIDRLGVVGFANCRY